jgi:cbb3-type cytochrome oxidase subunit 1
MLNPKSASHKFHIDKVTTDLTFVVCVMILANSYVTQTTINDFLTLRGVSLVVRDDKTARRFFFIVEMYATADLQKSRK